MKKIINIYKSCRVKQLMDFKIEMNSNGWIYWNKLLSI